MPTGTPAAVLVIVGISAAQEIKEIVLTKRTWEVETHKGQMSFPGGFHEASDGESLYQTAVRETHEELGIAQSALQRVGPLEPVQTLRQVIIYPFVVTLKVPYPFRLSSKEVEKVLCLPFGRLMEEGLQPVTVEVQGKKIQSEGILLEGELIWGATARILRNFRELLTKT